MMQGPLLHINADLCKECYACIRICPVKAIELRANETVPYIADNRCIGCGSCLEVCHPNAIVYYDSRPEVRELLKAETPVAAILDPSISAEFYDITDYRKFVAMLKQLGFKFVHEAAFGVDLVAREYYELVSNFLGKYYILANCPPIVSLIEKFHPSLIDNLAPLVNPMVASAKIIHNLHGEETRVVFIGPCLGAKTEVLRHDEDGRVDAVLMFDELRRMFEESGVKESTIEYADFDEPSGNKGSLYALSDGILQAAGLSQDMLSGSMVTVDGRDRILTAISQFEESIDYIRKNFNVFYCEGCIMGPGMKPNGMKLKRRTDVVSYVNKRLSGLEKGKWIKEQNRYSILDLRRSFEANDQRLPAPPKEKVEEILKIIGKGDGEPDLGCKACGYESCRSFAEAVASGIARTDMCVGYSLRSKQEYIRSLKVTNDKLAKTQQALKESEKQALEEKQATQDALETMQTMLRKLPTAVLIVDESLKIVASNESFITILGEEAADINEIIPGLVGADLKTLLPFNFYKLFTYVLTSADDVVGRDVHLNDKLLNVTIFSIKKNKIAGGVIRDMYMPEVRREEVINRVTEVIEQNLELVQQIAFLLGEGASKTEKMLNSIIESHQSKEE